MATKTGRVDNGNTILIPNPPNQSWVGEKHRQLAVGPILYT